MNLSWLDILELFKGVQDITPAKLLMIVAGLILIYLAIVKQYEPVLLLPIGFGCIVTNLPFSALTGEHGFLTLLYQTGIVTELFPLLIFVGVGAMIDFSPLLSKPSLLVFGAAGQFGIFGTLIIATLLGYRLPQAASIGVIGAIDGPTSIYVATKLAPELLAPIAVAAYSYMSLIPIIQPPIMKLVTSHKERATIMAYVDKPVSKTQRVVFPIGVTILVSILVPEAAPLISMLMLGNLLRESGVVERLSQSAQNEIINVSTLFLGLAIGSTMKAENFVRLDTLVVLILGLLAFGLDTLVGLLFGKFAYWVTKGKINPLIGAAGISAFPMAGRLAARLANDANPDNFLIMQAMATNTAGQIASVIAGGVLLALVR
ncbi:MAG: sodium ion-translocating decarboxylase subunit beta [Anaerolineae bacterium]|jgi:oxaloacetate decarboxylase beta subunit|nr:MAG: sodium ion-translocating decarboxylase subunit beta [Anaerolineae bacterium]